MPPKVDVKTLVGKMENAGRILYELIEEFEIIFSVKPELKTLEAAFHQVDTRYRLIKKQQETILDRLVDDGTETEEELLLTTKKLGDKVKADFLQIALKFAAYQKEQNSSEASKSSVTLEALTSSMSTMSTAVTKMADTMVSKPKLSGLQRLPVPKWDGCRRSYATWKKEFNLWMVKYDQDKDEQLQRFRNAMPQGSWWTDQVKTCKTIDSAWKILDTEFADRRKLMDELLSEINNLRPVKGDSKSFTHFATTIACYVNDMEDNGCPVLESSEAPFLMSQLLSKLDPKDNSDFGREMKREGNEETVSNLIAWLHQEASIRSRGKTSTASEGRNESRREKGPKKSENNATNSEETDDETCPLGCKTKHHLAACPKFQNLTVNKRWEIVKQHWRCRKCLRTHHTNDCKKPDGSTCDRCQKKHHRSLHNEKAGETNTSLNPKVAPFQSQYQGPSATWNGNIQGNAVYQKSKFKPVTGLCPVQKVKVLTRNGNFVEVLAMLDTGSNTSLLSKNAARRLGLSGSATHITMNLAGGKKKSEPSQIIDITVASLTDEDISKTLQVYTVTRPCSSAKTISKEQVGHYTHLKNVSDKLHLSGGAIDLLIGTDFVDAFVDIHTVSGGPGEPIAKRNCFGWYVLGQFESNGSVTSEIQSIEVGTVSAVEDIKKLLHQDLLGVKPTKLCSCSENVLRESKFMKSLAASTTLVDGRIQVKMPWKEQGPPKRSNYDIALKRMLSAEKSLQKKGCFRVVDEEVRKLLEQNFVTKVPPEQIDHGKPEWYLPLQAVFTPERTTKVRLVFDSSSKGHDGLSLNDHLEKGPNFINSLLDVLAAWRWNEVAFTGDVRKMFNQVLVHPEDQVYHRFLWRNKTTDSPTVYQWLRLNFGDKPAPDIATNAINTLAKLSQAEFPEAAKEVQDHVYVDDIGGSRETTAKAKQITNDIDTILKKGHFQIKAWHSNQTEIDQSNGERHTDLLGLRWDKQTDKFTLKKNELGHLDVLTKRRCLGLVSQLWDPIGLVLPVAIKFRIDLQELWSSGYDWDEILLASIQCKWKENVQTMNHLLAFEFDRKLKPSHAVGVPQVHGFCDGGEKAYGAVIFLRWELMNGSYKCVPVLIKSFVAPLKKKSVPRLELMGCLTLTRMYDTCRTSLQFANIQDCKRIFWVDSSTVLSWIKTPSQKFKPFVSARVAEIQESVGVDDFRYIRSKSNPADTLTRGTEPSRLTDWLEGPSFLQLPEAKWPSFRAEDQSILAEEAEVLKEMKTSEKADPSPKQKTAIADVNAVKHEPVTAQDNAKLEEDNPIFQQLLKSCSTFPKIRRTLAYVRRFAQNARKKNAKTGPITVQELKESENQLFKWSQLHLDPCVIDKKLIPSLAEDGLIRAHGRLEDARSLPQEMRNPVILPRDHLLVKLLLRHLHNKRAHCGYKSLMHEARRKYWIIGLSSMSKALTAKCITCRKLRKKPLDQLMGQIPSLRVAAGFPPFSNTAIDMFGPVHIKLNRKTLKEAQVVIFACMTTRAIHLELVSDKTSDAFLMAFRRFASLRGHPSVCWSDCGTNFVGAQAYLKELMRNWNIPKIQSVLSEDFCCDFKWLWNIPHASHQNGVVETLIKSVRKGLDATCKNRAFTEQQWRTFLSETTYIINGRPLYSSSNNIWESPPITPNDILMGHHLPLPQPESEERVNPRHLLRSTQDRVNEFWKSWMRYFAPNLLPRNKWFRTRENVEVDDLVLELDPNQKRSRWKLARVVATYPGNDGLVRKARIKTQGGEYDRPIHKLCLIATKEELNT